MSGGICKVFMLANVGAEPDMRYTGGGMAVLNFRVAVNRNFTKDGDKQEATDWYSVAMFGKRGEGLAKVLKKGDRVCISGDLRTRSYDDRDGVKRTVVEVVADDVTFAGSKRDGAPRDNAERPARGNGGGSARAPNPDAPADDFDQGGGYGGDDSDIPFIRPARGMQP